MAIPSLMEALGYLKSGKFISPAKAQRLPASELSFALRRIDEACEELAAESEHCRFHGTYVLQEKPGTPAVPVVYAFEAESDETARKIHRMVWNQNLVPFIIVTSPSTIRVYPGFAYVSDRDNPLKSFAVSSLADIISQLPGFDAESIDSGTIWQQWGHAADPTQRVDEKLLRDLMSLDRLLQQEGVSREASHGLIGKFVYLYYLRDRDILSNRKLEKKWGIDPADVFSRKATLKAFRAVNDELQRWLNGSVFQLGDKALATLSQAQLQTAASVFCGDSPEGQLHLDFQAYDFSHIPIETLSCVYEQFLHDNVDEDGQSRGKRLGAYYTPIPLADYVIAELNRKRPLKEGMRVLDPACGSGTFLVECYRRLIEKKIRSEGRKPKPSELRDLLTKHIFGIDRDDDACRIAELSLILTLLDYVEPPDLENTNFKLPILRKLNIFKDDFFDLTGEWHSSLAVESFDWIVGNPPWSEIKGQPLPNHDHFHVWKWILAHKTSKPVGGKQIAEAFLWKASEHLTSAGVSGFLVPAMTWFKKESVAFRKRFFSDNAVWCLANFANFLEVLFARRARSPASAVFYENRPPSDTHVVSSFSPFVAEQVANRPQHTGEQVPTWSIVVNGAEVRDVPNDLASSGDSLTWKIAMWGSMRDVKLLKRLNIQFASFEVFRKETKLTAHQGLELRSAADAVTEPLEHWPDLIGKPKLESRALRGIGNMFAIPDYAIRRIAEGESYVRKGRAVLPRFVSNPPHVIVDASRRFAIFASEFIAVPQRQIGIAGRPDKEGLLRALSLYLSSDFCRYHQFFSTPQWGIYVDRADLNALKKLPVPLSKLSTNELTEWQELQMELSALSAKRSDVRSGRALEDERFAYLINLLNDKVSNALNLRDSERWLIEDFVNLNLQLNKGKVSEEATRMPTGVELILYLTTLRTSLDGFLSPDRGLRHKIEAVVDGGNSMFSVSLHRSSSPIAPRVYPAGDEGGLSLLNLRDRLRSKHSQWVYFDRNLKIYHKGVLFQFKPMQRLHWTRRQAVLDSDDIIAETVSQGKD